MSIVLTTDFTDEFNVSKTLKTDKLQAYIDRYEKHYLIQLLGAELYDLFIADLTATSPQVPQSTRFLDIFNEFSIDDNDCVRRSEGMRVMLKQFIYFHFVRDSSRFKTSVGVVQNQGDVSTNTPYDGYNLVESYNQGVTNATEIQWFICDNDEDYPEENMQLFELTSGI